MLKLFRPYVSWRSVWNVLRVLFSGQLAEGPEVKKFEAEFAKYHGLPRALAVNSGTSALELAAHLLDLKPDDEVIIPVLTCAASVVPFARRCKVVFADIADDLNVDVEDVARKITEKTKAVVFVSFGGSNARLPEIAQTCIARGIKLVHDAAQVAEVPTYYADFTCVSLQATKILTSGDGGMLVCLDPFDHERAKKLRWFGLERGDISKQTIAEAGYKFHMNDIAAAIGRGNLQALQKLTAHREKLAKIYREAGLFAHQWLAGYIGERVRGCDFEQGQHHYRLDKVFGVKSKCPNMDRLEGRYWFVPYGHHVSVRQAKRIANALK